MRIRSVTRAAALAVLVVLAVGVEHVSVNMVDLFWNYAGYGTNGPEFANASMASACNRSFNVIRFAGTLFWPVQMQAYHENRVAYLGALTNLSRDAHRANCKLIPSLFWNMFSPADMVGEHLGDAMRNRTSAMRGFVAEYVTAALQAIADGVPQLGDVLTAVELGNEFNLIADLNLTEQNPSIDPVMGTPKFRTSADNFSTADLMEYESWLATVIRTALAQQPNPADIPVSTGHAVPRPDAEHLRDSYHLPQRNWSDDTVEQFQKNLVDTTACCDWVSIHYYPGSGNRFGVSDPNSTAVLGIVQATITTNLTGKQLYLGEFGNANPGPRNFSFAVLTAMRNYSIPLATIWIWEFYQFSPTVLAPFSLVPGRDDAIIDAMEDFNLKNNSPKMRR